MRHNTATPRRVPSPLGASTAYRACHASKRERVLRTLRAAQPQSHRNEARGSQKDPKEGRWYQLRTDRLVWPSDEGCEGRDPGGANGPHSSSRGSWLLDQQPVDHWHERISLVCVDTLWRFSHVPRFSVNKCRKSIDIYIGIPNVLHSPFPVLLRLNQIL